MATTLEEVSEFFTHLGYGHEKNEKNASLEFGIRNDDIVSSGWVWLKGGGGTVLVIEYVPRYKDGNLVKIDENTKYFDILAQELLKINSQYYFGAWEIDRSGYVTFSIKTVLENNPLTIEQLKRILHQGFLSLEDNEKILYILENGEPMPEKVEVKMTAEEKALWDEMMKKKNAKKKNEEDSSI
ncbi:MAG: hypothetical protein IJM31_08425 [Campylobacter sp.]|nr:hypothetical protein [Campylobacter sp.]MBQ9877080.1 hypothetical protein [Campylobacter sp.]MBR0071440.1 hypothetical protein [Campylobacter sp.]